MRHARVVPFLFLVLLGACATAPEPVRPVVSDESTFLGLAVGQVSELSDPLARAELFSRLGSGYLLIDDAQSSRSLTQSALELLRGAGLNDDTARARLALAPLLAATGDDASARSLTQGGLEYAAASVDSELRAHFLPLVVQSVLQTDEAAPEVLRRAVNEVFVIEDPAQRAEALIRIAELYQTGTTFLPVTGLIQQAIPAIRSADGPYRRASLFSRLALIARATNETRLAERLVENTIADVSGSDLQADGSDAELLLLSADRLAQLDHRGEALELLDALATPYYRLRGLLVVAGYVTDRDERTALLRQAVQSLLDVPGDADRADAEIRIGNAWVDAGASHLALSHAQAAADRIVSDESLYSRIEPAARIAALLVRLERLEPIRELLELAPDDYVRGTVAVRTANALIQVGQLAAADDFLTLALLASDEATYLADGLRQQTVSGFARTGSIRLAIRTIERMDDELLLARSVVELAIIAEPAGLVRPLYRSDLASVLAAR